jgi:hypothetical protein
MKIPELIRQPVFRLSVLGILLLELFSFIAWALPSFGNIAFIVIALVVLALTLKDLRIGIAIVLMELIIGSHGYLFSLAPELLGVAIRHAIFLIVMTVGALRVYQEKTFKFYSSSYFFPLLILTAGICFSAFWGLIQGNELSNIFFDANAFLFLALAIPLWQAIESRKDLELLVYASLAALIMSTVKVFFLLYAFSHQFWWMLRETYKWVRDTRIGEITQVTEQFFRVFFQSQVYTIVAFFLVLMWFSYLMNKYKTKALIKTARFWGVFILLSSLFASILISFSRSNWVGVLASAVLMPFVLFASTPSWGKRFITSVLAWFAVIVFSLGIVSLIVLFPYPKPSGSFDPTNLLSKRAFTFSGEAGVSSRWQLLPPLVDAIKEHVVLGGGFGTTVTYITEDPRIRAQSPTGEYTTIAFEWGYLDLWLKLGLVGMLIYAFFVLLIMWKSFQLMRLHKLEGGMAMDVVINQGLFLGAIAVLATHTFSPYLNHPLGIGFLLFWAVTIDILSKNSQNVTEIRSEMTLLVD